MMTISETQKSIHKWAKEKGWWDDADKRDLLPAKLLLVISELTEGFEEVRNGRRINEVYLLESKETGLHKPEGFPIELADAVIRIFDLAEFLEIDLEHFITMKMNYNRDRPYRHGGKTV